MKYISLLVLSMLFSLLSNIGCGLEGPPPTRYEEPYDWRAELAKYEEENERKRADPVPQAEGIYSTLVIRNSTTSSTIRRCTTIGGNEQDLLIGRQLRPGQQIVLSITGSLPKSVKMYWSDGGITAHSVPTNGRLIMTDSNSGYQGTNIQIVND